MHIELSSRTIDSAGSSVKNDNNVRSKNEKFSDILSQTFRPKSDLTTRNVELACSRREILHAASINSKTAMKLANDYAHNALGSPLLDLSDRTNIRYSLTGEPVTSKSSQYFQQISQAMQRQCETLYQQETAKGTPAITILEKIFSLHDTLPPRFRDMLGI